MESYTGYETLKGVYLEDSYVLNISESPGSIQFVLEAVLTPENPRYSPPKSGEQYCYMDSILVFDGITKSNWERRSFQPYTDASGEVDYGNIDALVSFDDGYRVEGDWGSVRIWSSEPPRLSPLVVDESGDR